MTAPVSVVVYSNSRSTRRRAIVALGPRPVADLPEFRYLEIATAATLLQRMDSGCIDVAILDGEATPAGGMGIAKQLKDELGSCPPLIVLTGRSTDDWLARWSRADAAVPHPVDPAALTAAVVGVVRTRLRTDRVR